MKYLTLDVGGANVKKASITIRNGKIDVESYSYDYYPLWKKTGIADFLRDASSGLSFDCLGLTFTAEVSDAFPNKKDGVKQIIDSVHKAFPGKDFTVLSNNGELISPDEAIKQYLNVASANWYASAYLALKCIGNGIYVDMGSTTTDVIPLSAGKLSPKGKTDLERLKSQELIYSGALRSSLSGLSSKAPLTGGMVCVANEYFACTGDVYRILGFLRERDYVCETPDGRGKSKKECLQRLARMFLADGQELNEKQLNEVASYYMEKQLKLVADAIENIAGKQVVEPRLIGSGIGEFILKKAAKYAGLKYMPLSSSFGDAHVVAPCIGLAYIMHEMES